MLKRRIELLINILFVAALMLTLGLLLLWGIKGWEEQSGRYYRFEKIGSHHIANITVNLGGTPVQEHCRTCHPEGRAAVRIDSAFPGRIHPNIAPHSIYDLGCTACHLGEGMAADLKISHGRTGTEARKVLAGEDLQASCYLCHELKPLRGADRAWPGVQLFSETACDTCHASGGGRGGSYGPNLSDAGSFLGLLKIRTAIENPKADLENSIMPKFALSPEEVNALSYFLKSRVKEPYYETPMMRLLKGREQERLEKEGLLKPVAVGKELLKEKKCLACHKFGESEGQIGPDLSYMAFMRPKDYIRNFLHSPRIEIPGAIMPIIPMNRREEEGLLFVLQQKEKSHFHRGTPKNTYMMLCQRCHAAQGDGFGVIEPNLATFPRTFRNNSLFFKSIPDAQIVGSITRGIPGTSMPPSGELLGQETINSLVDLLFQVFIRTERMVKVMNTPPPRPKTWPSSEENLSTFRKKCSLCHGIQGKGKGPAYLKYRPRPRDLTNYPYFRSLTDERIATAITYGIPGTEMRPFINNLRPKSIWGLVSLVRNLSSEQGVYDQPR
ncbi:MAG: c-type cytochrome [Deltaproteobacteria bacterium]|nr:c-type cytochrome [Deltaproteobacteria bacterium]